MRVTGTLHFCADPLAVPKQPVEIPSSNPIGQIKYAGILISDQLS